MPRKAMIIKRILKESDHYSVEYMLKWSVKDLMNYLKSLKIKKIKASEKKVDRLK